MTRNEKREVMDYINGLYNRINSAKNCIRDLNFGKADLILSEPYPKLNLRVDEG